MPRFEHELSLGRPVPEIFAFFVRPANLVLLSPPELRLRLIEGPETISLGTRYTWKARRWGAFHRATSEVTAFEPEKQFVESQCVGPFREWVHTHLFESVSGGTRVRDTIDFETPGGALGLIVNARAILKDLEWIFAYRAEKLRGLFG